MAILCLLEEAPMHPYRMQVLLKERGKSEVINVAERTSLYKAVERLLAAGLIAIRETMRDPQRPERTIYELTDAGRATWRAWLTEALSTPAREFPEFPAAMSLAALLGPDALRAALEQRVAALRSEDDRLARGMASAPVPRLFLLEDEYRRAVLAAEIAWLDGVVADLKEGRLAWDLAWIQQVAAGLGQGPE
jgi:DNA-binding PadR family transcriptional regulator